MPDICVIVVSRNHRSSVERCLTSLLAHTGGASVEALVVDTGVDGAGVLSEARFPGTVRGLRGERRGFGAAANLGIEEARSRYVLLLDPDVEFLDGSLADLVAAFDGNDELAVAGVRVLRADGSPALSIRRFPSSARMLADAFGLGRMPLLRRAVGEIERDARSYERETDCDWIAGPLTFTRRAALEEVGCFDERFFLFAQETDLCWRLKQRGWKVAHLPLATVSSRDPEAPRSARLEAQSAYARLQFARKNLPGAGAYRWALALRYTLRISAAALPGGGRRRRRDGARAALATVVAGRPPVPPPADS